MKKGRPTWLRRVGKSTLERIRAAVLAGEDVSVVYVRSNLQQYGCSKRTFTRYVKMWQRDYQSRIDSPEAERSATADDLIQTLIDTAMVDADAGRPFDSKLADLIRAACSARKLDLDREAGRRAEEKHAAWKAEHAKKQSEALESQAAPIGLTPEQLAAIKSKVLGL